MSNRPLFARPNNRKIWLWRGATLVAGIGVLGAVVAKVSSPGDPALNHRIDQDIATELRQNDGAGASATRPLSIRTATPTESVDPHPAGALQGATASLDLHTMDEALAPFPTPNRPQAIQSLPSPDSTAAAAPKKPDMITKVITVKSGDSLSTLFSRAGLGYGDVHRVMALGETVDTLKTLHPGEQIAFRLSPQQEFRGLSYDLSPEKTLNIKFDSGADKLVAQEQTVPLDVRLKAASGKIDSSLYQSAIDSGIAPGMIMQLAEIFGWKINFLKDVRDGDRFNLVYEEKYRNDKQVDTGNLVAAEYTTRDGQTYKALRYTAPDGTTGYYEPDGKNLERGFLRYPVKFSRISSRFNLHRMHPIYHRIKAHKGVDFAAPTGTPIHASGNGKIEFIGWQHGYGKVIKIKHDPRYESVYGHMSRFNKSLKRGSHVDKGEVIGYVGMTGAATGPHLHYEFHVNGKYKNPLKVALPEAHPIPSKYRTDFLAQTQPLLDRLASVDKPRTVASSNPVRSN